MSPVSGGITLKRSHAYRPRRAFLNQWTGPGRPFQHTLKQGHLTEIQVCGESDMKRGGRGVGRCRWRGKGLHVSAFFTIYLVKMCPFIITVLSCASVHMYLCFLPLKNTHFLYLVTICCQVYWVDSERFSSSLPDQN